MDILLLKLGEVVLKGLNRKSFEMKLVANCKRRLAHCGNYNIYCLQSTIYVEPKDDACDIDAAEEAASKIFGIASVCRARACEKDKDVIFETAKEYLHDAMLAAKSFKVESKRSDKRFPLNSIQLSQYVGGLLSEAFPDTEVDVHNPELLVNIEVRDLSAYVHGPAKPGAGGLPVGTSGVAVSLLSGGIDSPVSTYMMAKRGLKIIPLHFFSFPYTSELAKEKVLTLAETLTAYCGRLIVDIVPFTHIQEEIRNKCPEEYFTLIMRRFMMRIAEKVAEYNNADCLVTGENLGQVASQTTQAIRVTESAVSIPVMRPLIGFDKEDIIRIARKIGTFGTSVLPYEDCCTVFTPKHPKTKPNVNEVAEAESVLDIEALVNEAFAGIEKVRIEMK